MWNTPFTKSQIFFWSLTFTSRASRLVAIRPKAFCKSNLLPSRKNFKHFGLQCFALNIGKINSFKQTSPPSTWPSNFCGGRATNTFDSLHKSIVFVLRRNKFPLKLYIPCPIELGYTFAQDTKNDTKHAIYDIKKLY